MFSISKNDLQKIIDVSIQRLGNILRPSGKGMSNS